MVMTRMVGCGAVRSFSILSRLGRGKSAILNEAEAIIPSVHRSRPQTQHRVTKHVAEAGPSVTELQFPTSISCPRGSMYGEVAVIGLPNAGKSTLVNCIVGAKIAAASPKYHTTRQKVLGIWTEGKTQLVFIDTPGILSRRSQQKKIQHHLTEEAWSALREKQEVVLVVDAVRSLNEGLENLVDQLKKRQSSPVVILNKVDLARTQKDLDKVAAMQSFIQSSLDPAAIFRASALKTYRIREIKDYLVSKALRAPWVYPPQWRTTVPLLQQLEEIIREKVFLVLHQEIPYGVQQENEGWTETGNGLQIDQILLVASPQHKEILTKRLGLITRNALPELRELLQQPVYLRLRSKVAKY